MGPFVAYGTKTATIFYCTFCTFLENKINWDRNIKKKKRNGHTSFHVRDVFKK